MKRKRGNIADGIPTVSRIRREQQFAIFPLFFISAVVSVFCMLYLVCSPACCKTVFYRFSTRKRKHKKNKDK